MVIKHIETRIVEKQYFNSEDEAINWWSSLPIADEWEIVYLKEREPSGHRYALKYTRPDERGILYSKYIICFSKEEDFDAFWIYERSGENEYTSVDAFSKFEDAIDSVKAWLK